MAERESKLVRVCYSTVCVLFSPLQLQIPNLVMVNRKYCNFSRNFNRVVIATVVAMFNNQQ
jgi:hypothetical protein